MAVTVTFYPFSAQLTQCPAQLPAPAYFMCDTEAELPHGRAQGDMAYTRDSDALWIRTATTWAEIKKKDA